MLLEPQSSPAAPPMSSTPAPAPTPSSTPASTPTPAPAEYTIDELAAFAKVPSRTIRFYQSRGALMPPEIRGRVAFYGPSHIDRLKLIAQLQDRGLRIDAIRDLLTSIDRGEVDLAEWLGVERQVQAPWANDQPRTVTEEELYQLAGSRRPGLVSDLLRAGTIERRGDVYLVESPALLAIAMKLEDFGVDVGTAMHAESIVRKHIGRAASEIVGLFVQGFGDGRIVPKDFGTGLEALRPLGMEAVRVMFGRAMEHELRKLYESGALAKIPARAHRARKGKTR